LDRERVRAPAQVREEVALARDLAHGGIRWSSSAQEKVQPVWQGNAVSLVFLSCFVVVLNAAFGWQGGDLRGALLHHHCNPADA